MPRPLLRWCPPFSGDTPISVVALTHPSTPLLQPGSLLFPITSLSSFLPSLVNPSYGIVLNCFSSAFFPPLHPHIPFHLLYSMTTFTRCTLPTSSILFLLFLPLPPPFHPLPLFLSGLSILFFLRGERLAIYGLKTIRNHVFLSVGGAKNCHSQIVLCGDQCEKFRRRDQSSFALLSLRVCDCLSSCLTVRLYECACVCIHVCVYSQPKTNVGMTW